MNNYDLTTEIKRENICITNTLIFTFLSSILLFITISIEYLNDINNLKINDFIIEFLLLLIITFVPIIFSLIQKRLIKQNKSQSKISLLIISILFIAYSILIIIFISSTAYGAILTNNFFIPRFFVVSYSIVLVANTYLALKIVLSLKQIKC